MIRNDRFLSYAVFITVWLLHLSGLSAYNLQKGSGRQALVREVRTALKAGDFEKAAAGVERFGRANQKYLFNALSLELADALAKGPTVEAKPIEVSAKEAKKAIQEAERARLMVQEKAEKAKKEAEEADRKVKEAKAQKKRADQEAAQKAAADKRAQEKLTEAERARKEAERKNQPEPARKKAEEEKQAQEAAAQADKKKLEAEEKAKEAAKKVRLAQEEAARKAERLAQEEAARKAEQEKQAAGKAKKGADEARLAQEEADKLKRKIDQKAKEDELEYRRKEAVQKTKRDLLEKLGAKEQKSFIADSASKIIITQLQVPAQASAQCGLHVVANLAAVKNQLDPDKHKETFEEQAKHVFDTVFTEASCPLKERDWVLNPFIAKNGIKAGLSNVLLIALDRKEEEKQSLLLLNGETDIHFAEKLDKSQTEIIGDWFQELVEGKRKIINITIQTPLTEKDKHHWTAASVIKLPGMAKPTIIFMDSLKGAPEKPINAALKYITELIEARSLSKEELDKLGWPDLYE